MSEHRALKGTCELRDGPNGPVIYGYAAVFNRSSENLGGFIEQVDPSAFAKTLQEADVRGLGNHDVNWLLGRSKSGTLRLSTDQNGLMYEIDVNTSDPDGQRALAKVKRGDWDGSSFSFQCVQDAWDWSSSPPERRLLEVKLVDVGPVTMPAYPDATVASRALDRVAAQHGLEARELAAALQSGEIRSLLGVEPAGATEERAVWSTAYVNDLPDSAFLYIEPGGEKDSDGKTKPRTLRHFPYRDANGKIDLPHLRNALARIPQSSLPADVKDTVTAKAKRLLNAQNSIDDHLAELRAGKAISAANAKILRDAISAIQSLLDSTEMMQGGGLMPGGGANSLPLIAASRLLARFAEERAVPDAGGDPDNLAAMTGAVAAAYLAKRQDMGLDTPEDGFALRTIADQDGDADGDGQSLFCVSDCDACWYVVANGDQATVVAWDANDWGPGWRSSTTTDEPRSNPALDMQRLLVENRDRQLRLQQLAA